MPCTTPCKNCDRKGLPILFTRYAAAYSTQSSGMEALNKLKPMGQLQAQPGGVAMETALYNVRMLRPGCLYVRVEYEGLTPEWSGYAVHPHGYLMEFPVACPQDAKPSPACEVEIRGANASMVWVRDAEKVISLHYLFHPDPLDYQHLRREIEPNRDKYMQKFDVAAWAKGSTSQKDTLQPGQLNGQVVEFAALSDTKLRDAMDGQFFGLMGTSVQERVWGDWEEEIEEDLSADSAGQATGPIIGSRTVVRKGLPYAAVHSPHLKKIAEYLQDKKGAVVACHDAIGIAQTLAMSHPMAALPYELWLHSAPDKALGDFPKLNNGWLLAAQGAIDQLLGGMKAGLLAAQAAGIDALKRQRDAVEQGQIPTNGRYEQGADGKMHFVPPEEVKRRTLQELDQRIARGVLAREEGVGYDAKATLAEARRMIDQGAVDAFDSQHQQKRKELEARLNAISADTIAWLDAAELLKVGDRYNGLPSENSKSDGVRFALQLAVALLNLDSSETGRQYLLRKNPFTYARDNLVARLIGCNDPAAVAEVQAACGRLQASAVDNGFSGPARDADEKRLKQIETLAKELGNWGKVTKSAEKMHTLYGKPPQKLLDRLKAGNEVYGAVKAAAGAGWSTVVFAAVTLFAIQGKATQREGMLMAGQALALTHGLGAQATELLKKEAAELADRLRRNPTYGKVGLGRAADWLKKEQGIQNTLQAHVAEAAKGQAVLGKLRVRGLLLVAEGLGVLVGGGIKAGVRQDVRSALEGSSQLLSAVGSYRDIRAMLCEEMVFKTLVPKEGEIAAFAKGTKLDAVAGRQLIRLKTVAGSFAIAGSTIMVGLDGFDGARALKDENKCLATAYFVRALGGGLSIGGVAVGMRYARAVLLATRLNLVGMVLTVVSTIAIELLKDNEWQTWFKSQPFRIDKYASNGSPMDSALKPTPHKSQEQMISRLDEALKEAKGG